MAKIDLGSVVGPVGPQGPKPVKGTDYYTEEEKQQFTTETVGLVTTEGTKQTKSVTDEGTKQVQLITEKISEITSTGDLKLNAITTEGKNKLEAVTNEGNRILSEIGKILETSPEGGNALQLGGKTRSEFDKEIQGVAGGYAGKFPLDSAVLDGIYLLPDTGKFYVCTKAFSGKSLIVPDSNFEELSVYKNRERLSNLFKYILVEEKISKWEEHKVNIGVNGHAIFESSNYQELSNGIYRIISQRSDGAIWTTAYCDFIFTDKKIVRPSNITFISYANGEIKVNLDQQVIAISAHSSAFHNTLKVRLYRVE